MQTTIDHRAAAPTANLHRHDVYAGIHKALRLFMTDTLTTVGAVDPRDDGAVVGALAQVTGLLEALEGHIAHENHFVHPMVEAAAPGTTARIAAEHVGHAESIADLRDLCGLVDDTRGASRERALSRLYLRLALFVAENLIHMHDEQTAHNEALWARHDDDALRALEGRIAASVPPLEMSAMLRWFVPAFNAPERAAMLGGLRQTMPSQAFDITLDLGRRFLSEAAYRVLLDDLAAA